MFPLIGSLVGAGASLLGGMMNQQTSSDNMAMQQQINQANIQNQQALNAQNIAEQEKFAQQGIQWRAADARAAGINPLAALGAQTASFSNNVGTTLTAPQNAGGMGAGVAAAGQDISRAISATRSAEEQAVAIEKTRQDLEKGELENQLLKAQVMGASHAVTAQGAGPARMVKNDKSGDQELVTLKGPDGTPITGPSRASEGWAWLDPWAKEQYAFRNQVLPMFGYNVPASERDKRPGWASYKDPVSGWYYHLPTVSHMGALATDFFKRYGHYPDDMQM